MARNRASAPLMRHHLSGQAAVSIGGRDYYLGKWGSPEASARHAYLLAEYKRLGQSLPEGFKLADIEPQVQAFLALASPLVVHLEDTPITVGQLAESYRGYVEQRFGKPHQNADRERKIDLVNRLVEHDGPTRVADFGPIKLKEHRQRFLDEGNKSRRYVNRLTNEIRSIFRWGVSEELVSVDVVTRLECVSPLRGGEASYELPDRQAVSLEHVQATIAHLSPVVRDMLRVQLATGMRPCEVCRMKPCEIDRTGDIWHYRPSSHKTAWKGHTKEVPLVGDARAVVEEYLNRKSDACLFSPKESLAWFRAQQRANRVTKVQPSQVNRSKQDRKREPGDTFTVDAYTKAIKRAAKAAGVPTWTAYQVRHLVGTVVAEALKLEDVKALLGHADLATTQIYAKSTKAQSIRAASVAPKLLSQPTTSKPRNVSSER